MIALSPPQTDLGRSPILSCENWGLQNCFRKMGRENVLTESPSPRNGPASKVLGPG